MKKKLFQYIFITILLLASALRFYKLGAIPVGLYWDEVAMLVDAKSVAQSGLDMHGRPWYQLIFPSYGDYKLPVYIWFASVFVKIFGVNEFALRLPSAVAGITTVAVSGYVTRWLIEQFEKDKKVLDVVQLSTMLAVAINPWPILFSRTGFEGHVAQLFMALSIAAVLFSKKKPWVWWLAPMMGAVATYTYFSVRFVWPIVFVAATMRIYRDKLTMKNGLMHASKIIMTLLFFVMLLVPMTRANFYNESNQLRYSTTSIFNNFDYPILSNQYRELAGNTVVDRLFFHRHVLLLREFAQNIGDHLSLNYLFVTGDQNLRHGTGEHGLFLFIFLPFLFIGLIQLFQRDWRTAAFLTVWWAAALIPASVPEDTPHALRSLNALVPISAILGYGLTWSWLRVRTMTRITLAAVVLLFVVQFVYHYFYQYTYDSATAWQGGYRELAQKIFQKRKENGDVPIYVMPFDERFYLWIMAYGPFSAQDFHSWKTTNFMSDKIENIYVKNWMPLNLNSQPAIIVSKEDMANELLIGRVIEQSEDIKPTHVPYTFKLILIKDQQ